MSERCSHYQEGNCGQAIRLSGLREGYGRGSFDTTCTPKDQEHARRVFSGDWKPIGATSLPHEGSESPPQLESRCYRAWDGASQNRIENQ